jgi:hypothetical protein
MLLAAAGSARAQTLQDVDKQEAALEAVWEKTPLTVRQAFFVTEHPSGFGEYTERSSHVFKPGEPLTAYVEPVGYGWKDDGNGTFDFGLSVDFLIKNKSGNIVAGKENFLHMAQHSHAKNKELMLTLNLNLNGAPAGDYTVEYKLHDLVTEKTATVDLPFTIAAQ